MKFYYVYILASKRYNELYIGLTVDLKTRVDQHNKGLNKSTKRYMPWKLIYYEACLNEQDAKRREGYLKKTQGRRMIRLRLKNYFYNKN